MMKDRNTQAPVGKHFSQNKHDFIVLVLKGNLHNKLQKTELGKVNKFTGY